MSAEQIIVTQIVDLNNSVKSIIDLLSNKSYWLEHLWEIVSLLISIFIGYHIFHLSKRLSIKDRLEHKQKIKKEVEEHLYEIHSEGLNSEVYLVNINRYYKDYPSNSEKRFEGYSHLRAELKAARFDGIEFFAEMPIQIYQKQDGKLYRKGEDHEKVFIAFPVGVVPYEWIEHIDFRGDEYGYVPLFYCRFGAPANWNFWRKLLFMRFPYKKIVYYKESETYVEGNDPPGYKYQRIKIED